jgi:hypothetical protein
MLELDASLLSLLEGDDDGLGLEEEELGSELPEGADEKLDDEEVADDDMEGGF